MAGAMDEQRRAVLVLRDGDRAAEVERLIDDLRAAGCAVEVSGEAERVRALDGIATVYADWSSQSLTPEQGTSLAEFARAGGTIVAAGATMATWASNPALTGLSGWSPDGQTVHTELEVSPAGAGEPSFRVDDRIHLLPEPPEDATPLLTTHWRFAEHVVAYSRAAGSGRFVYLGLGRHRASYANDGFRREALRAVGAGGRRRAPQVIGVGLLGFGALGRAHIAAIDAVPGMEVRHVCDRDDARRGEAAALGMATSPVAEGLYSASDIDVVIVGTPPADHASSVLAAIEAGKHVVCEKPFAITTADCDRMIERAQAAEVALTVFHNRRWDPDFLAMRRVARAGGIGDLFYMESFVGEHEHPCHYWHSHEPVSGGSVYDWGSHYIDWTLQLFELPVTTVRAVDHRLVWHDVTNADHITVEMGFESGAQAFFTQSSIAAARKPKWYLLGTQGAVVGDWQHAVERSRGPDGEMDERVVPPTDLPASVTVRRPSGAGTDEEALSLGPRDRSAFYRNLAGHLRFGEPLAVTPQQARRTVAVMEAATQSAARGGALIAISD